MDFPHPGQKHTDNELISSHHGETDGEGKYSDLTFTAKEVPGCRQAGRQHNHRSEQAAGTGPGPRELHAGRMGLTYGMDDTKEAFVWAQWGKGEAGAFLSEITGAWCLPGGQASVGEQLGAGSTVRLLSIWEQ
jgi:hypothetical protein